MLQRRYGSLPVCKFLFSKQVYVRTYLSDRGSPQRCSGAGVSARGPRQGCGHGSWARSSRLRGHRARRAAKERRASWRPTPNRAADPNKSRLLQGTRGREPRRASLSRSSPRTMTKRLANDPVSAAASSRLQRSSARSQAEAIPQKRSTASKSSSKVCAGACSSSQHAASAHAPSTSHDRAHPDRSRTQSPGTIGKAHPNKLQPKAAAKQVLQVLQSQIDAVSASRRTTTSRWC